MVTHISQTVFTAATAHIIEETQKAPYPVDADDGCNPEDEGQHICAKLQEIKNQVDSERAQFETPLTRMEPNVELQKIEQLFPKLETLRPILINLPKTGAMIKELDYFFK